MRAKYLGLDLPSPIIVSSSPYTSNVKSVEQCAASGAGAVHWNQFAKGCYIGHLCIWQMRETYEGTITFGGAQQDFNEQKRAYFKKIEGMHLNNPLMVGFGISNNCLLYTSRCV